MRALRAAVEYTIVVACFGKSNLSSPSLPDPPPPLVESCSCGTSHQRRVPRRAAPRSNAPECLPNAQCTICVISPF